MRQNPERTAWLILLTAFTAFCVIVVAVPLSVRWVLFNAQVERKASVESLAGTIVVEPLAGSGPIPLGKGAGSVVPEGSVIYVDETSEAVVTFADQSFMRVYPGSTVRLDAMRAPRYRAGIKPFAIYLTLLGGRVRLGSAVSTRRRTGHGRDHLDGAHGALRGRQLLDRCGRRRE